MCCSVCQWSRANVKVASGAAPRKDTYTIRRTPAATAASTVALCSATRSADSVALTISSTSTLSSASSSAGTSPYDAAFAPTPSSRGARAGERTTRRSGTPAAWSCPTTAPPIRPVAPVTPIMG